MRVGTLNLVAAAATVITPTSEDPFWLAENLKSPQRCFLPTRTVALGDQSWVIDYGSAKSVDGWGLINLNVTTVKIQANATNAWGGVLGYDSGTLTLTRNPNNGRYSYTHRPSAAQAFQFNRLFVPSQTPVADQLTGVVPAFYEVGGLYAGLLPSVPGTTLPAIRWAYKAERIQPSIDKGPEHKGWEQRLNMGDPRTRLTLRRLADAVGAPLLAGTDELSAWLELERVWSLADYALVSLRDDHPGLTWMMRIEQGPEWDVDSYLSESDVKLLEVVR